MIRMRAAGAIVPLGCLASHAESPIVVGGQILCVPLLELARRRALLTHERHSGLKSDLEEISRMLFGLMKGLF
jgi:hypothetical protein